MSSQPQLNQNARTATQVMQEQELANPIEHWRISARAYDVARTGFQTMIKQQQLLIEELARADEKHIDELIELRPMRDARKEANDAYRQRNLCVSVILKMARRLGWTAGVKRIDDTEAEPNWHYLLFVDLPSGQCSWHIPDEELPVINGLPHYVALWDGHSSELRDRRLADPFDVALANATEGKT